MSIKISSWKYYSDKPDFSKMSQKEKIEYMKKMQKKMIQDSKKKW